MKYWEQAENALGREEGLDILHIFQITEVCNEIPNRCNLIAMCLFFGIA